MVPANNMWAKIDRTIHSFFPVSKKRRGQCLNCGRCCHLPHRCWFLRTKKDGTTRCIIHKIRPLNCRKYPRVPREHITAKGCGYYFEK